MKPYELCELGSFLFEGWGWQKKLARELCVDDSTVRRWISGASPISQRTAIAVRLLAEKKKSA